MENVSLFHVLLFGGAIVFYWLLRNIIITMEERNAVWHALTYEETFDDDIRFQVMHSRKVFWNHWWQRVTFRSPIWAYSKYVGSVIFKHHFPAYDRWQ